jgi:CheY-like chemotaxis protein
MTAYVESRTRVLVVDDQDEPASLLKLALEDLGCTVAVAHDAPIAINVAKDFQPQLAFLDLRLPVMDGYELARRLRAASEGLRVVAVTGMTEDAYRQRSAEAGFLDHLVKPVDPSVIRRIIASL